MPKQSRTKKSIKFRTRSPIKTYKRRKDNFLKKHSQQRATLHKKYRTRKSPMSKSSIKKSRYRHRKVSKSTRPRITFNLSKNTHYEYNKTKPPRTLEYLDKMIIA